MFPTTSIQKLHNEHKLWVNELNFCKEEIAGYERHLEAAANEKRNRDVSGEIEHFQNQFIRQKEVIDELKHTLNEREKQLVNFVKSLSGLGLESIKMDNHSRLREEMQLFRKIFNELKEELRLFEKKWL